MGPQCGFEGNADLYGLGIRLGIYLQWFSSMVVGAANLLEEADSLYEAYLLFTSAIAIAIFVLTFGGTMHTVEVVIMLYVFYGGFSCMGPSVYPKIQSWDKLMYGFSAWFWIGGRKSNRYVQVSCGVTLFLFARIPPKQFEPVSIFFAALSIFCVVASGRLTIQSLIKVEKMRRKHSAPRDGNASSTHLETRIDKPKSLVTRPGAITINDSASEPRGQYLRYRVPTFEAVKRPDEPGIDWWQTMQGERWNEIFKTTWAISTMSYSIISVELMLYWNGITDVYSIRSVGQLIPFVIGLAGLLKVCAKVYCDLRHRKRQPESKTSASTKDCAFNIYCPMQQLDGKWQ